MKNIGLPKILNYKKSDYKGGSQNWDIEQSKKGNLYFANTSGLIEYNGTSWNKYILPGYTVRAIKISKSGRIYAGGYNELGYFEPDEKGKLVYHTLLKLANPNTKKTVDFVWKIHILNDEVFFQTFSRTYIYKDNKIRVLEAPNRFQFSFVVNNKLYFQDISKGLVEYRNGKLLPLKGTEQLNDTEIWGLLPFKGNLLIITLDKGLFIYRNNKLESWDCEANAFILKNNSLGGRIFNNEYIVLNSVLDGIVICNNEGKIVQHINNKKGLQNNTALSSFIDNTGNLWLGLDNGISYINENSPFTYLGSSFDLSSVYASAKYDNKLYVATNQGVFSHVWEGSFKEESFNFIKGTTGQAWNVNVIDDILFCPHNRGLFIINKNGSLTIVDDKKGYFGLKKLKGTNYFIASNYHGFSIIEKSAKGYKFRNQVTGFNLADNKYDTDGKNVWIKKNGVIYKLTFSDDYKKFSKITTYNSIDKEIEGITSLQKIRNTIYFQTDNRFFTYNASKDTFVEDLNMSALFKDLPKIRYCVEDNKGNICYFYGDSSMGMLMKEDGGYNNVIAPFTALTGNLVYFYESVNTIDSRNIFIGLTEGLAHYDPEFKSLPASSPKAYIRNFIFNQDTLFKANMPALKNTKIPYRANNVKFTFSSPIYDNPENTAFSYKLKGFDEQWSHRTNVPVKEYTNLQEGDYTMMVKVINSYGTESEPATAAFTITPPFYRHYIAYISYIVITVFSVFYIRRTMKQKIRKKHYYQTLEQRRLYLEKESKIKQEQYELEKEIERLKNEQLRVKILTKDKELVNNSLQVAKKNKMLNGIIKRLKEIDTEQMDDKLKLQFNKLQKTIQKELNTDKSWNNLEKHIKNVHFDFLKRLKEKHPTITPREMDLATYLLMNMSTKEIAEIMNISDGGVELARYRLRKKLNLPRKENLTGFLMSI
ncbi:helix-turn-helix and ligand-binding sensor domain-containing protein [Flavobacterium rhizosphaerae]|uniref:Triple tyrosine motif-containing protein n=1 Tax=Flavobacterium rhizosphaerae TaxID=3163298 RepID=A0ABW8Z072_9FLAO